LLKGIQLLKNFPGLGKEVQRAPEPDRIRDLVVDRYVVRYLVGEDTIYVLRIWHHREHRSGGSVE
jgi:plasmid stabilization system protein ParE